MKSYYYIDCNGKQNGPIPASLLKSHGVDASTYVWTEGMSGWTEASNVPELRTIFPVISPQPTPPRYQATPTSTHKMQCPYCKSYLTSKLTGRTILRWGCVFGAATIGMMLTPVGAVIAGTQVQKATENWDNWECLSCMKSFRN